MEDSVADKEDVTDTSPNQNNSDVEEEKNFTEVTYEDQLREFDELNELARVEVDALIENTPSFLLSKKDKKYIYHPELKKSTLSTKEILRSKSVLYTLKDLRQVEAGASIDEILASKSRVSVVQYYNEIFNENLVEETVKPELQDSVSKTHIEDNRAETPDLVESISKILHEVLNETTSTLLENLVEDPVKSELQDSVSKTPEEENHADTPDVVESPSQILHETFNAESPNLLESAEQLIQKEYTSGSADFPESGSKSTQDACTIDTGHKPSKPDITQETMQKSEREKKGSGTGQEREAPDGKSSSDVVQPQNDLSEPSGDRAESSVEQNGSNGDVRRGQEVTEYAVTNALAQTVTETVTSKSVQLLQESDTEDDTKIDNKFSREPADYFEPIPDSNEEDKTNQLAGEAVTIFDGMENRRPTDDNEETEQSAVITKDSDVNEADGEDLYDLPGQYRSDTSKKRSSIDSGKSSRRSSQTGRGEARKDSAEERTDSLGVTSSAKGQKKKKQIIADPREKRMSIQPDKKSWSFTRGRRASMPEGKPPNLGVQGPPGGATPSVLIDGATKQDSDSKELIDLKSRLVSTPSLREVTHSGSARSFEGGKSEMFRRVPSKREVLSKSPSSSKHRVFLTENYHDGELENLEELPDIAEYKRKKSASRKLKSTHSFNEESHHSVETITEDKEEKETSEKVQKPIETPTLIEQKPSAIAVEQVDQQTSTESTSRAHNETQTICTHKINEGEKSECTDEECVNRSIKRRGNKFRKAHPNTYYTSNRVLGRKPKIKHFNVIQQCTAENIVETIETRVQLRDESDMYNKPRIPLILDSEAYWRDDELNIVIKAKGNYGLQPITMTRDEPFTLAPFAINVTFVRHDNLPKRKTKIAHKEFMRPTTKTHPSKWMRKFSPARNNVLDSRAQGPEFITSVNSHTSSKEFPSLPKVKGTASPTSPR